MKLHIRFISFILCIVLQGCSAITGPSKNNAAPTLVPKVITVQGQAEIIKGAKLLARKQAFKQAIRNAAMQSGVSVSNESLLGSTKIVDEWIKNNIYHMQVLTVVSDGVSCNSPYRKRVLVTGFPIVTSGQVNGNESQDLYSGIPREIMNLLMETGRFIGRNKSRTVLYSRPDMAPEMKTVDLYSDSIIVRLAQEEQSHFVLSGVIRDLEVESTDYVRGSGVLSQMKSLMRDFVARRGIGIDVYVHDGNNGALLFQHRYTDSAIGDVWIPAGYTVGSERFKSTPTGHKISNIIRQVSADVDKLFSCYPFSAKVIKVVNNKVFIAAGTQDKLKRGDSLVIYTSNANQGLQSEKLVGVVNITDVQANHSIGQMELESDVRIIKAGDVVKSW